LLDLRTRSNFGAWIMEIKSQRCIRTLRLKVRAEGYAA
jgi:hypothetical protein